MRQAGRILLAVVSCLFAVGFGVWFGILPGFAEGVEGFLRMEKVHGNFRPASVTIEDGFGFEAVVPVKSPIKSSRWDALRYPAGFFVF